MRYLLLLSMLVSAACTGPGTLLNIEPPSPETAAAEFYDVFWFNGSTDPNDTQSTCVAFDGAVGLPAEYVVRMPDAQTADGPQPLPTNFKTNGLQLLISGDRSARVAVALLDANKQLVGVATYDGKIQVSEGDNRRYQLATQAIAAQTGTLPTGEWRAGTTDRTSVLRFPSVAPSIPFEYRIAPNRDFDGDSFPVATSDACPTIQNRNTDLDCNDLSASVTPQPGADDTCGRAEPDVDCQFDPKPAELCAATTSAATCTFGVRACGDGSSGECRPTQSMILFPAGDPFCAHTPAVTPIKCVVQRGAACRDPARYATLDAPLSIAQSECNIALLTAPVLPGGQDIEFKSNGTVLNHNGAAQTYAPCKLDLHLDSVNVQTGFMYVALGLGRNTPVMFKVEVQDRCDPNETPTISCDPFMR